MVALNRMPLRGGGCVLIEGSTPSDGPVKAGRIGDTMHELPGSLQAALEPITEAARATLEQLRKARPDAITVEFGVNLAVEAGAVITKSRADGHLKVTVSWERNGAALSGGEGS